MRKQKIAELISQFRNPSEAERYYSYRLEDHQKMFIPKLAQGILANTQPRPCECLILNSFLAFCLGQKGILVATVIGDLIIEGRQVFNKCTEMPYSNSNGLIEREWDGHCWIEIDDYIGDISLFRTADITTDKSLKDFLIKKFGFNQNVLFKPYTDLTFNNVEFIPKFVLNETQITNFCTTLDYFENNQVQ